MRAFGGTTLVVHITSIRGAVSLVAKAVGVEVGTGNGMPSEMLPVSLTDTVPQRKPLKI